MEADGPGREPGEGGTHPACPPTACPDSLSPGWHPPPQAPLASEGLRVLAPSPCQLLARLGLAEPCGSDWTDWRPSSMSWRPWSLGVRCGVTVEAVGCRALSRERVWGLPSPHQLGDFASLTGITGLGGLCGEQGWMGDDEQLG